MVVAEVKPSRPQLSMRHDRRRVRRVHGLFLEASRPTHGACLERDRRDAGQRIRRSRLSPNLWPVIDAASKAPARPASPGRSPMPR
jgi:hypothetical protein